MIYFILIAACISFILLWILVLGIEDHYAKRDAIRDARRWRNMDMDSIFYPYKNRMNKLLGPESTVDETTLKLVRLATNNPNDNEARNAAMKVCERIAKVNK
jgi:hypothetical protein